jgi:hypothetical protein
MRVLLSLFLSAVLQQAQPFQDTAVIPAFRRADPDVKNFHTLFKRPIDDAHLLLIVRGTPGTRTSTGPDPFWWGKGALIGVFLMDRSNPSRVWELVILEDNPYESVLTVQRFDATSLVLARADPSYGIAQNSIKLFFHVGSKRLLRRVDYPPVTGATRVVRADEKLCATMAVGETSVLACMQDGNLAISSMVGISTPDDRSTLGSTLGAGLPPLPQSTYDEFAHARPDRVRNGYDRRTTTIEETAGSYQTAGDRVWFGKTFYDGEGVTGVGAIGYFDRTANRYVLVNSAELAAWSTSALLIEDDVAWVGLVRRPEGASRSGGLLRYDLQENRSSKFLVPDIILTITRWNGALYLGTTNGLYVIREDAMSRFRIEPGPSVEFMIISESVSGSITAMR